MTTKNCPNCSEEVPAVANLCKHCFHDFRVPVVKRASPIWTLLLFTIAVAIAASAAYGYRHSLYARSKISIDQETKSIVFTTTDTEGTEATRVYFKDIAGIEYRKNAKPRPFEVVVRTTSGRSFVYSQSSDPLDFQARQLSDTVGQPLSTQDEYRKPDVLTRE